MIRNITIIMCSLALVLAAGSARAITITVGTFADQSGSCSLRDAVASSNSRSSIGGCATGTGSDTIQLASGKYVLNRSIEIGSSTTISGASTFNNNNTDPLTGISPTRTLPLTTITVANKADRLFVIDGGFTVSMADIVLQGGYAGGGNADTHLQNGGAIWSASSLTLDNVQFLGNTALGQGGAIFINGPGTTLTATESSFEGNKAASGGSGIGSTCYSASAAESHTFSLSQDLFYANTGLVSGVLAPAVQSCGDLTLTFTNDTFAFNDKALALTGSNVGLVNVNATSVSLSNLTVIGQIGEGLDFSNAVNLASVTLTNSVIAFNGSSSDVFRNCSGAAALSTSGSTSTIVNNRTGHGCSLTDGGSYTSNTADEKTQAVTALDGGVFTAGGAVNPNLAAVFYLPNAANPGATAPPGYGGLTGVYFPQPNSGLLINQTSSNCQAADQRGAPRNSDTNGCTIGAVEPKKLVPVADTAQNLSGAGAARQVVVSVLANDLGDEDGTGPDGIRYVAARVHSSFSSTDCANLNGGTVAISTDGTQIIYSPSRPPVSWKGAQVPGPGALTNSPVVCNYRIEDNKSPANISQTSSTVTMTVADIAPIAVDVTYTRPYNGNAFFMTPLTGDSDPDGLDGQLPPAGAPRSSNSYTTLTSADCVGRQLVHITTMPALGTVVGNVMATVVAGSSVTTYYDGNLTYTPGNSFSPFGDSFQYVVLDADCQVSNAATVTINTNAPGTTSAAGSFDELMLAGGLVLVLLRRLAARRA